MSNKQLFIQSLDWPAVLGLRKLEPSENNDNVYEFELRFAEYDSENILKEHILKVELNCGDQYIIDWLDDNGYYIDLEPFSIDVDCAIVCMHNVTGWSCSPLTLIDHDLYRMLKKIDQNEE
jgi:hypothetical protein